MEFQEFPKISRLARDIIVTEKIDGTNASVIIEDAALIADWSGSAATPWLKRVTTDLGDFGIAAGSRTRYITVHNDNFGWANWVAANANELIKLGPGRHFGEWWGSGIQRGYGLQNGEKRFSLFNVGAWADRHMGDLVYTGDGAVGSVPAEKQTFAPACCYVVPTLYTGPFTMRGIDSILAKLENTGSVAVPGFMKPEGVVVFHKAGGHLYKKTIERDDEPHGRSQ
jgi:hypothetical protein